MSSYKLEDSQKPFHPQFNHNGVTLEAKIINKTSEITEIKVGIGKRVKSFPVRKGDISAAFLKAKTYLNSALKGQK